MQVHRNKNAGCLEMSHIKMVAGLCAAAAVGMVVILALDLLGNPGCGPLDEIIIQRNVEPRLDSDNLTNEPDQQVVCTAAPSTGVCNREWEMPSVVSEREWERLQDENTPEEHREFIPLGVSAFLFVQFGAYRGGPRNFSIVGLSPKALHVYGNPRFDCFWIPRHGHAENSTVIQGNATAYLPGIKLANQYTGTVIHCTFEQDVGADGAGGILRIVADIGSKDRTGLQNVEFVALTENPGEYDASVFDLPKKYDYMYCGSPLYGDISPQRVREWVAYHARIFGPRSHFVFYDAGGLHDDVRTILSPWVKLGRVTIMNYRQEARYDSHYHSQAVVVNDCLLLAKTAAEWAFFFDLDEYLYVPPHLSLDAVMQQIATTKGRRAQQVTFDQRPMNPNHCVKKSSFSNSDETSLSEWGIEKLVFQRTQVTEWGGWKDHKYAVQTRYMLAAGTHDHEFSFVPDGMRKSETIAYLGCDGCGDDILHYHHYHNTISIREDLCKEFVDPWIKETKFNNVTHIYDNSLSSLADAVRQFELDTVGKLPFIL